MHIKNCRKIPVLILVFLVLSMALAFAVDEERVAEEEEPISKIDTVRAVEIRIGDEGIYIRTETGQELRYRKGDIPDVDLELEAVPLLPALPPVERTRIRMPRVPSLFTEIVRNDIVKAGSDIVVEENELVKGDVTALGGDVTIRGKVDGSVVAVGGDIMVTPTGEIEKDATSIGGDIRKEAGGLIRGQVVEVGFVPRDILRMPFRPVILRPGFSGGFALSALIFKILLLLFIGLVVFSVAPGHVGKVKAKLEKEMLKSGLVGFLGEVLILPIFVLLLITIIGIPVALLVQPLLILLAVVVGYTAASLYIGEKVKENTNIKPRTALLTLLLGIIVIELIPVVALLIGAAGGPGSAVRFILSLIYWALIYLILTIGFGAVILTRFGTRPKEVEVVAEAKKSTPSTPT
jgi:hypothetical protein